LELKSGHAVSSNQKAIAFEGRSEKGGRGGKEWERLEKKEGDKEEEINSRGP